MKQFGTAGLVVWVLSLATAFCQAAQPKLHVLTSFLPAYCFVANVAGNTAEVENLLPGSASPHDYQLSPGDVRKIAKADLIVVNGLGVEAFLDRAIANSGSNAVLKIVTLSQGLSGELIRLAGQAREGRAGGYDPHIWLDPILAAHCVTNILRALQKADARNAATYARNAATYIVRLKRLNEAVSKEMAPIKANSFVTYHDAFRYFVRRYDLKLAGVVERVPEVTPSPKEMGNLLKTIREQQVKALFAEPSGDSRLARQIAADAKIKLDELDPLETGILQPDSYEIGMKRNANTLARILR